MDFVWDLLVLLMDGGLNIESVVSLQVKQCVESRCGVIIGQRRQPMKLIVFDVEVITWCAIGNSSRQ